MSNLVIEGLDPNGNGIARAPDGAVTVVPNALPGEGVGVNEGEARRTSDSDERATPACPLFGRCGSCAAQHMGDDLYTRWKTNLVRDAFARAGLINVPLAPLRRAPLASRRRVTLTASGKTVGYHRRGSHDLVDVTMCPALDPKLAAHLPALRAIGTQLADTGEIRLTATLVANGIDVAASRAAAPKPARRGPHKGRKGKPKPPAPPMIDNPSQAIVRLTLDGEILFQRETPMARLGEASVSFPPGAFLQASRAGERHLVGAVLEETADARRVADLYCGLGTFTLPLAKRAEVLAVESHSAALEALAVAAAGTPGLKSVTTLRRDLMRDPMSPAELAGFDAVVFDPPRAGAKAQAEALARTSVPTLVAVSCHPATLARDCAILAQTGYKITQVVPVDQFVATAHIEVVATLRRD